MAISLNNKWIWDSWYARDDDTWHAYFLQADKALGDPELRHWNVTQGHATSKDLINWEHLGTTFEPAKNEAWDDYTTWTGSVIKDDHETWHLFVQALRAQMMVCINALVMRLRAICTTGPVLEMAYA